MICSGFPKGWFRNAFCCVIDFENEQPLGEETQLNVSYGDNPQQKYDLYLPEGRSSEKTKIIILIHGGGWIDGDKEDMNEYIPILKEKHPNHAIVNINYVLAAPPSTPAFPNQFLDVGKVINKLTQESEELELLPEFGLIGASAGAHIALQYDYVYDTDDKVKMICDIVGPTDFTDPFYTENPNFQILLNGTKLQISIWHELKKIPYGKTKSYGEIAKILNTSPRYVGNVCGQNKHLLIIPECK